MLVFLPKGNDLKAVEEFINHERFSEWRNILKDEQVLVYLPRFKFETKYFMKSDFMAMGITTAFSTNADFSGMTGNKKLNISEVIHQTFVDVNEEGTEAAGATAAMATEAALGGEIKTFLVDHPFIFVIQDRATGNILFMGRGEV
ncbi:MAG: hypothetical protein NTV30_00340 [Chloroflexi bacterium]|nr:hypothetical protein [Chloroflexota bacterium]